MINVLHVIGYLGRGGDTTVVLEVMKGMDPEKVHFDFLTHDRADPETVESVRALGCRVYVLRGDLRKSGPFRYYRELVRTIKNAPVRYDAVHVHTGMQSGFVVRAAEKCGIKKRICHSHVTGIQRNTAKTVRKMITPLLRHAYMAHSTDFVACSKMAGEYLFGQNSSFTLLYNGIDIQRFRDVPDSQISKVREELGISDGDLVIGHVAHFGKMKNHSFDLEIAGRLKDRPEIRFVLVGKGPEKETVEQAAKEGGDQFIFTGQRADVPVLMNLFDCLILPSLPGEGFPVTVMEAQAAGCPCLVSNHVTSEAEVGLGLVSFLPLDAGIWADTLRSLNAVRNRKNRQDYADCLAEAGFDREAFVKNWLKIYS